MHEIEIVTTLARVKEIETSERNQFANAFEFFNNLGNNKRERKQQRPWYKSNRYKPNGAKECARRRNQMLPRPFGKMMDQVIDGKMVKRWNGSARLNYDNRGMETAAELIAMNTIF